MDTAVKIFSVLVCSAVKFVAGPPLAYLYDFGFAETILLTTAGGMAGVWLVSYYNEFFISCWKWIAKRWFRLKFFYRKFFVPRKKNLRQYSHEIGTLSWPPPGTRHRIFTPRNRRIVRIWRKYGLFGIALLSPVLISIPVGTFLATRLVSNRKKVLLYMFCSVLLWSLVITTLVQIYHIVSISDLQTEIIK